MVQILGFFSNTWDYISFSIINGIFVLVAKVYDYMLQLASNRNAIDVSKLTGFATTVYVLAGVFMLFRVLVSLIQMLINPEQIADKQAGAGKIMTRVVMVIVMLMLFAPNGLLFGTGGYGLFSKIESALLEDNDGENDGLIVQIMKKADWDEPKTGSTTHIDSNGVEHGGSSGNFSASKNSKNNNFLIENVEAASSKELVCYYYDVSTKKNYLGKNSYSDIKLNKFYKIIFSLEKKDGYKKMRGNVAGDDVDGHAYYYVSNARVKGGEYGDDFRYASLPGNRVLYDYNSMFYEGSMFRSEKAVLPDKCPQYIDTDGPGDLALKKEPSMATDGILGGYKSPTKMINDITKKYEDEKVDSDNPAVDSHGPSDPKTGNYSYVDKLSTKNSLLFAQASAASLQECTTNATDECKKAQQEMFKSPAGNAKMTKAIQNDKIDVSFIFSVLAGIGILVFLLYLCIEILVRRLKLFFLELIAPLPIMCYIDPKDKIFNSWLKMYFSTYLDLFIKLISISMAITLLGSVAKNFWSSDGFFTKFFYLVAILSFAKIVPTMISKIFGIDSMGGSFKDILGMGKAAAGFGVGAIAGAGAGLITGASAMMAAQGTKNRLLAGAQGLGSGFSGLARGAGAGMKGNVFGGAKSVAGQNENRRNLYASGVSPMAAVGQGILSKFNADYATRKDKKMQLANDKKQVMDNFAKHKSDMQNTAMDSKFMKSVMQARKNGVNLGDDKVEYLRDKWIDAQLDGVSGSDFINSLTQPGEQYANEFADLFSDDRFGFDYVGGFAENGKREALITSMSKANSDLSDSKILTDATHVSSVGSFADLDSATKSAKQASSAIERDVYAQTEGSARYRTAKTVRDNNSGGKNQ